MKFILYLQGTPFALDQRGSPFLGHRSPDLLPALAKGGRFRHCHPPVKFSFTPMQLAPPAKSGSLTLQA